ncbi:MAG: DUF6597 domain-containing transcriptional factor [Flavobacteriaceae bacterium]
MIFETYKPDGQIGKHIESLIYFKDLMPDHSLERVIPTGHVFIIFELDGIKRKTYDNNTLQQKDEFSDVWVSGVHKNYITISAHEDSEMFVIQFKPYGAYPYFQIPLDKISNCIFHAKTLFGKEILELRTQLLDTKDAAHKFGLAQAWLESIYDCDKHPPEVFLKTLERIEVEKSATNFDKLFADYPFTRKHLISQFKKYIGITPKYYQRIIKFNDILVKIQKKESLSWAQLTYDYGFSDQPHFIKTFKHFSGFSPKEFIYEGLSDGEPNFFPLDKQG